MTDPIADMIIRIKNALMAGRATVEIPHSKLKQALALILVDEGYVDTAEVKQAVPVPVIEIGLKYVGKTPAITNVRRISKPGKRTYAGSKEIPSALGGYGITIISTNKGIVTDKKARQLNVGGEVLCQIW